jgi:hypothetical protein
MFFVAKRKCEPTFRVLRTIIGDANLSVQTLLVVFVSTEVHVGSWSQVIVWRLMGYVHTGFTYRFHTPVYASVNTRNVPHTRPRTGPHTGMRSLNMFEI